MSSIYEALAGWFVIAGWNHMRGAPKRALSRVFGGPAGFLTAEQRAAVERWPGIKGVDQHGGTGALIRCKPGYKGGTIDILALYNEGRNRVILEEEGIFMNANAHLNDRMRITHHVPSEGDRTTTLATFGCTYTNGRVMTEIPGPPDAGSIAEAALRVAAACCAMVRLADPPAS